MSRSWFIAYDPTIKCIEHMAHGDSDWIETNLMIPYVAAHPSTVYKDITSEMLTMDADYGNNDHTLLPQTDEITKLNQLYRYDGTSLSLCAHRLRAGVAGEYGRHTLSQSANTVDITFEKVAMDYVLDTTGDQTVNFVTSMGTVSDVTKDLVSGTTTITLTLPTDQTEWPYEIIVTGYTGELNILTGSIIIEVTS